VTSYTQQSIPGSRADAEPTDRLPTLVPGRDPLPTVCSHPGCNSRMLDSEEPLGPHQRGMVWCRMCSRSLCWLAAPLAAVPSRSAAGARVAPVVAPPATAELVTVRRRIIAADFERRPGCGRSCTPAYGHDPLTHEQHGADAVYADLRARRAGDVVTGPLVVQLGPAGVYVDGAEIALAPYDWEVLAYLAEHLGDLCTLGEITASVWGQAYYDNWKWKRWQPVRNNIMRIKQALGPAAPLIENEPGRGYRLADAPPC
jgi:DNA-binding winged helix-turn-helix (wHTH) protein